MVWLLLVLAGVLSAVAGLAVARANPGRYWPAMGLPPSRPCSYYAAYAACCGLAVWAGVRGSREGGDLLWLGTLGALLIPLLVVRSAHNRSLSD